MTILELTNLLNKWKTGKLSDVELEQFLNAIQQPGFEQILEEMLQSDLEAGFYNGLETSEERQKSFEKVLDHLRTGKETRTPPLMRVLFSWKNIAAALFIGVLLGTGYWFFNKKQSQTEATVMAEKDIEAPKHNHAVITLPDGSRVAVDSLHSGQDLQLHGVTITKGISGELALGNRQDGDTTISALVVVENPRASQPLKLILADGTLVWLNAESSIQYPIRFVKNERKVTIAGEVYFEVAKNKLKKFIVQSGSSYTEVLGTKFNVRSYSNEAEQQVTLLEGAVNVISDERVKQKLRPSEQVRISAGKISAPKIVDVEDVMAWTNNLLRFNNEDIRTIMLEIGRWYNMNISFKGAVSNRRFSGTVSRETNLSQMLDILERSGMQFKIKNRTIVVIQ